MHSNNIHTFTHIQINITKMYMHTYTLITNNRYTCTRTH